MSGCVSIQEIDFLIDKLTKTDTYMPENKKDLRILIQILKDYNYPLIELADIISIVIMLEYILSDYKLIEIYRDFIKSSLDVIAYILGDKTYLKIEDRIIRLESDFYQNICENPKFFEEIFYSELKKTMKIENNLVKYI